MKMRNAFLTTIAALLAFCPTVDAAPKRDCKPQAIRDLEKHAPDGHAIYAAVKDKAFFLRWITCDDIQLGLATAVHETVHMLTEEKDSFPLVDGGSLKRDHSVSRFYAPREIAGQFDASSTYVQTYLRPGAASSSSDFLFLLDEMNAYSHDLNSVIKLDSLAKGEGKVDHRDGLTALMAFVTAYVDNAKQKKPATWQGLQRPDTKKVIQTLWGQAETVLARSCGMPGIGINDRKYIRFMCDAKRSEALGEVLERPVVCASACLGPETASTPGSSVAN